MPSRPVIDVEDPPWCIYCRQGYVFAFAARDCEVAHLANGEFSRPKSDIRGIMET